MQRKVFWIVYKSLTKHERKEFVRQHFWGWMMYNHPKIYAWCDKHLKCDTLPF